MTRKAGNKRKRKPPSKGAPPMPPQDPSFAKMHKRCKRKNRYATEREASEARARREHELGRRLKIYQCRECRGFHLAKLRVRGEWLIA